MSRSSRRTAARGHPEGRVAVGRPDLDDPPPTAGEDARTRPLSRSTIGIPSGSAATSIAASAGAERRPIALDPSEIGRIGDPASVVLRHRVLIRATRHRNTGPPARIVPAAMVPTLM